MHRPRSRAGGPPSASYRLSACGACGCKRAVNATIVAVENVSSLRVFRSFYPLFFFLVFSNRLVYYDTEMVQVLYDRTIARESTPNRPCWTYHTSTTVCTHRVLNVVRHAFRRSVAFCFVVFLHIFGCFSERRVARASSARTVFSSTAYDGPVRKRSTV